MAQILSNVGQNEYLPYAPIKFYTAPGGQDYAETGHIGVDMVANVAYIAGNQINGLQTWIAIGAAVGAATAALTVNPGNLIVGTGNITATLGNIVASAGDITASLGDITATAGSVSAGVNVTATGAIIAVGGDISATAGDIIADAGDIIAAVGDITCTAGDVNVVAGDIVFGDATKGITMGSTARILSGAGDPNGVLVAAQGSVFFRNNGASADEVIYVNTDGISGWAPMAAV